MSYAISVGTKRRWRSAANSVRLAVHLHGKDRVLPQASFQAPLATDSRLSTGDQILPSSVTESPSSPVPVSIMRARVGSKLPTAFTPAIRACSTICLARGIGYHAAIRRIRKQVCRKAAVLTIHMAAAATHPIKPAARGPDGAARMPTCGGNSCCSLWPAVFCQLMRPLSAVA